MAIYLDGQPTDIPGATLGDVVNAAQRRAQAGGRVVVEVSYNGVVLPGAALDAHYKDLVDGAEVMLATADPRELAEGTLRQVREALAQARTAQQTAADLLQQDDRLKAMDSIRTAMEAWHQTQQVVLHSSVLLGVDLDRKEFEGQPLSQLIDALVVQLKGLRDLIVAQDTVALADSLAYEWPAVTDRWDRLLGAMGEWVRE